MSKTPLQFITVGAMLGDREDAESITLDSIFSTDGSRNVYLDKQGRATSVMGYSAQSTVAVTSTVGAAAMRLRALYAYGTQTLGVLTRQLLGVFEGATTYELRSSINNGGTWTLVTDLGATYPGYIPDFAQLGNDLILTFGVGAVKRYDGTTLSNASATQLAAPSTVTSTNVGLLDGTYRWKVVPVKSDGTRKAASIASVAVSVHLKQIAVTWVADAEATVYEVYRTTGTGAVFFYETALPTGTVTFTSNTADLQLIGGRALQEYGDAPPSGTYFCEPHASRIFYGGTDTYPRRYYYSDPGLPYSVWADANFFDMTDDESFTDKARGGTGNFKGMFVAWLERSIWTVSGKGRFSGVVIDFERRRTDAQTGTVSHRTVARVPAGSVYVDAQGQPKKTTDVTLAYLTPLGDVRLFDGNNDTVISWVKQDTFKRLSYGSRAKAFQVTDVEHAEITWVFPVDSGTEPNYAVSWNLKTGMMTERQWGFAHAIPLDKVDDAVVILAGESSLAVGGFCYQLWSGYTNNGVAIAPRITTKTFYAVDRLGNPKIEQVNRWRWVDILVHCLVSTITLTVEWWPTEGDMNGAAFDSLTLTMPTEPLRTVEGEIIRTVEGEIIYVGSAVALLRAKLKTPSTSTLIGKHLYARGVRLRLSSTDAAQFAIAGMRLCYQPERGLKRPYVR